MRGGTHGVEGVKFLQNTGGNCIRFHRWLEKEKEKVQTKGLKLGLEKCVNGQNRNKNHG